MTEEEYQVLKSSMIMETPLSHTRRSINNSSTASSMEGKDSKPKQVSILGVKLKPGYSVLNFFAIPLIFMFAISFQQDVLSSTLPLLVNPNFFDVPSTRLSSVSNDMQFYPIPFQMLIVLVSGFIYDIYGRRKTISICFIIAGISAVIMPFTSPSVYPGLLLIRILFSMAVMPVQSNPLVNDYVT